MYIYGKGVKQDFKEAFRLLSIMAEEGNEYAQANLGLMYGDGKGVKKDYKKADEVVKNATRMQQKEETVLANASGLSYKELYHLRNVLEHIRRTSDYSADMAEVVMNFTVE